MKTPTGTFRVFRSDPYEGVAGRRPSTDERQPVRAPSLRVSIGERIAPSAQSRDGLPQWLCEEPSSVVEASELRRRGVVLLEEWQRSFATTPPGGAREALRTRVVTLGKRVGALRDWIRAENRRLTPSEHPEMEPKRVIRDLLDVIDRAEDDGLVLTEDERAICDRAADVAQWIADTDEVNRRHGSNHG